MSGPCFDLAPVSPGFTFAVPFGCGAGGLGSCVEIPAPGADDMGKAEAILAEVAAAAGITIAEIKGPCRKRPLAIARHRAMAWIRAETVLTLTQVGEMFGGRDHSSVSKGIQAFNEKWSRS